MKTMTRRTHTVAPGFGPLSLALLLALLVGLSGCGPGETGDPDRDHDHVSTPAEDPHAGHAAPPTPQDADHSAHGAGAGAEEALWEAEVSLDPERVSALGIRTVAAEPGAVHPAIRVPGSVEWDETSLSTVTLRYGGYIERLHVAAEGDPVNRQAPLLEIYSPELVAALEELLSAARLERQLVGVATPRPAAAPTSLLEAARRRLAAWEIPEALVEEVLESGRIPRTHTVAAASNAVVVERLVQVGERVGPGAPLFRLAARSPVWVEARIPERDMASVREGDAATIQLQAYPDRQWTGRVSRVYPSVDPTTRTGRVRIVVASPGGEVRPGMFASVILEHAVPDPQEAESLLIPRDAVIRAGLRDVVFVEEHPGHFVGREIRLGRASGDRLTVLSGLREGERVVARGAFLLDAESRLQTGTAGMDHAAMGH
jgi:membrane fusion protein, copper/silver efflux system